MLRYNPKLAPIARRLRKNLTESEKPLWSRLRGKQLLDIQFNRQKPIGDYIVDFYAPKVKLIIEIDGSQPSNLIMSCVTENVIIFFHYQGFMSLLSGDEENRRGYSGYIRNSDSENRSINPP